MEEERRDTWRVGEYGRSQRKMARGMKEEDSLRKEELTAGG